MKKIDIFGKEINVKEYACQNDICNDLVKIKEPYVNLYVKITEFCNAKCKFCEFASGEYEKFNTYKLYYVLNEIQKKIKINKVSFTGGEATSQEMLLHECLDITKDACPSAFIVLNTNGYNINDAIIEKTDSVSISRHHYDDVTNAQIFGTSSVCDKRRLEKISDKNKQKIHFSCNLIKGYIDSSEEIIKYLEYASENGINDVGFVSLMKVNNYCKENHVDFRDIILNEDIIHYRTWKNADVCACKNLIYIPKNKVPVKIYTRYNCDYVKGNESNLVFNGENLTEGFYGKVIY